MWKASPIAPVLLSLNVKMSVDAGQYLVAINMFNQALLMPRIIRQILSVLTRIPHGAAFVSIYESNSWDTTGKLFSFFRADLLQDAACSSC